MLFIHSAVDGCLGCLNFLAIEKDDAKDIHGHPFSVLLSVYLGVEWLGV